MGEREALAMGRGVKPHCEAGEAPWKAGGGAGAERCAEISERCKTSLCRQRQRAAGAARGSRHSGRAGPAPTARAAQQLPGTARN